MNDQMTIFFSKITLLQKHLSSFERKINRSINQSINDFLSLRCLIFSIQAIAKDEKIFLLSHFIEEVKAAHKNYTKIHHKIKEI